MPSTRRFPGGLNASRSKGPLRFFPLPKTADGWLTHFEDFDNSVVGDSSTYIYGNVAAVQPAGAAAHPSLASVSPYSVGAISVATGTTANDRHLVTSGYNTSGGVVARANLASTGIIEAHAAVRIRQALANRGWFAGYGTYNVSDPFSALPTEGVFFTKTAATGAITATLRANGANLATLACGTALGDTFQTLVASAKRDLFTVSIYSDGVAGFTTYGPTVFTPTTSSGIWTAGIGIGWFVESVEGTAAASATTITDYVAFAGRLHSTIYR